MQKKQNNLLSHLTTVTMNGNVVDWETSVWELGIVTITENVSTSHLCKALPSKKYVMFPELRDTSSAKRLCNSLGTHIYRQCSLALTDV